MDSEPECGGVSLGQTRRTLIKRLHCLLIYNCLEALVGYESRGPMNVDALAFYLGILILSQITGMGKAALLG